MDELAVVMICGPHHHKHDSEGRTLCTAFHQGTRCYARIDHATKLAKSGGRPLFVAGDANGGMDVDRYVDHARAYGVTVFPCVWTGKDPVASNTLLDLRMALTALLQSVGSPEGLVLVTDAWHMPRAYLLAFKESLRLCEQANRRQFVLRQSPCHQTWQPPEEMLARERQGTIAIADGTYGQTQDTYAFGKPVLEHPSRLW